MSPKHLMKKVKIHKLFFLFNFKPSICYFICFFVWDRVLHIGQADLELRIVILPQPPNCWDFRCEPSHLASCATFAISFLHINIKLIWKIILNLYLTHIYLIFMKHRQWVWYRVLNCIDTSKSCHLPEIL